MTMRASAHTGYASGQRGFTLVELLVAITIFVTVMASVALVFNGAIRTSKQGFQNQEAYELARGAMKVIERDLSRAFTNRNHGDVFNFYGTPIGFSYVGLISADESSAPNMARVTYVVYHDQFSQAANSVAQYASRDGIELPMYYLLRFIEPGADTLDSFPINWSSQILLDSGSPGTFESLANARVAQSGCSPSDSGCSQLIRQAAKREVWTRMLAGGGDLMPADVDADGIVDGDFTLPSAWSSPVDYLGFPPFPASPFQAGVVLSAEQERNLVNDYVVAENVRFLSLESEFASTSTPYCAANLDDLATLVDSAYPGLEIDFDDILYDSGNQVCVRIAFSPGENDNDPNVFRPGENDPGPVIFDDPTLQFSRAVFSGTDGARPFFTYWDVAVQENRQVFDPNTGTLVFDDPLNTNTANDKVRPVAFQFWNDWRNMIADGLDNDNDNAALTTDSIDNDGDSLIDEPGEGIDEIDEQYAESAGSPLDTRLPLAVTIDFTLFFRSPYPGAPDFNERFTQRIDLPTAYRRTFKQRMSDLTP